MLQLRKNYRRQYVGEDIVTERVYHKLQWNSTTETVPNSVFNYQISKQAVVLGNGLSRKDFNLAFIKNHQGGIYGESKLQTYGCNALYRDFQPDFLVVTDRVIAEEIALSGYTKDHICYSRANILLEFPQKYYLIPHDPVSDAGTTAAYLACFDGHMKVYLMGFDGNDTDNFNYNLYADTTGYTSKHKDTKDFKWSGDRAQLMRTYHEVQFVWVTETGSRNTPESWKECPNFKQIDFREFVIEANL